VTGWAADLPTSCVGYDETTAND